jgi:hypothetical protein
VPLSGRVVGALLASGRLRACRMQRVGQNRDRLLVRKRESPMTHLKTMTCALFLAMPLACAHDREPETPRQSSTPDDSSSTGASSGTSSGGTSTGGDGSAGIGGTNGDRDTTTGNSTLGSGGSTVH